MKNKEKKKHVSALVWTWPETEPPAAGMELDIRLYWTASNMDV